MNHFLCKIRPTLGQMGQKRNLQSWHISCLWWGEITRSRHN